MAVVSLGGMAASALLSSHETALLSTLWRAEMDGQGGETAAHSLE
jgi:hypothetical protein